jgi:elongation factor P
MDMESYEQIAIQGEMITNPQFLKESMEIEILFHAEKDMPLTIDIPQYVEVQITYTEPGVKGDTATNVTKPAKIETGAEIRVPIFINEGDMVKIDTKTGSYMERVKK